MVYGRDLWDLSVAASQNKAESNPGDGTGRSNECGGEISGGI